MVLAHCLPMWAVLLGAFHNPLSRPCQQDCAVAVVPIAQMRELSSERLSDLLMATQLVKSGVKIQVHIFLA